MAWTKNGDANMAFFHKVALIRYRRNLISELTLSDRSIVTKPHSIHSAFTNHFRQLWDPNFPTLDFLEWLSLPSIPHSNWPNLIAHFWSMEIYRAI